MDFRARAERLGAFGVTSVSLIVGGERGQTKYSDEAGSNVLWRSFNAVFATFPARKGDKVLLNDHCRILSFYQ